MSIELYDVISRRRDVRGQFTSGTVGDDVLLRVLGAAHAAPSVGLTQPWDFVLVDDDELRRRFQQHVAAERDTFAASLDAAQAATFARIKVEGILESALGVVVTYDPDRGSPAVLGRHAIADAGLYAGWRVRRVRRPSPGSGARRGARPAGSAAARAPARRSRR